MYIRTLVKDQIFARNYYLARIGYFCWFYAKTFAKQPLLIYQMGKVASTTVETSLAASQLNLPIFHFHFLSSEMIKKYENYYYEERSGINRKLKNIFPHHLFTSYFIRSSIHARSDKKTKWKIISLVRDPIARNISVFFQDIDRTIPHFHKRKNSITYEELYQAFLEKTDHEYPLNWFDVEFHPFFEVDVYLSRFPWEKGYKIYSGEQADVLLIRVENLSAVFSEAVQDFLNIENINLVSRNQAKDKLYSSLYKKFLERVALPGEFIEKMYASKFVRHFYSEKEIQEFISRWSKGKSVGF